MIMDRFADVLAGRWPLYAAEAGLLGTFMLAACLAVAAIEHPASPIRRRLCSALGRRAVIGVLMGATAIGLIYSPAGQASGAHMNPAVTLAFWVLGRIGPVDALMYITAQFIGGAVGIRIAARLLGDIVRHPSVRFAATLPGRRGTAVAWAAEAVISCGMMLTVLTLTRTPGTATLAGIAAGILVALYITFEAPLSGMSLNPARTLASAIGAGSFQGLWVYFTAPTAGMLAAAAMHVAVAGDADRPVLLDRPCGVCTSVRAPIAADGVGRNH